MAMIKVQAWGLELGHQVMQIIKYFTKSVHKPNPPFFEPPDLNGAMMLFLAMEAPCRPHTEPLSTKINVAKVLEHDQLNGAVHFAIEGDQGALQGPRVPIQGHHTMQTI